MKTPIVFLLGVSFVILLCSICVQCDEPSFEEIVGALEVLADDILDKIPEIAETVDPSATLLAVCEHANSDLADDPLFQILARYVFMANIERRKLGGQKA